MSTAQQPPEQHTAADEPPADKLTAQLDALQRDIEQHLAALRGEADRWPSGTSGSARRLDYREHSTRTYRAESGRWL
ncbi:hypothetical protein [Streptomyces sp. CC224B]|uniref:hypothetical protein n=1 Tax=Streptomyces sp. CC224B TaxID=3044571 RepID=UPI0024A93588|nr:hypothetical protein [Streptomyces sp. CC224B]